VLVEGEPVGVVTSGNLAPTLQRGIAFAFLPPEVAEGAEVVVDIRGTDAAARVVPTPFYRPGG
jgi:aminomethyltransferase